MEVDPKKDAADSACSVGSLHGVRVLDMTSTVTGPCATQILGDHGADVIRIEPPDGDQLRNLGPMRNHGMAAMFLGLNRNKRSIVLDLKQQVARDVFNRLLATADVFVHNMRPQAAEKLNVAYSDFAAKYPTLIYAAVSGYRSDGSMKNRPAFDEVIQGASGISSLLQQATGKMSYAPFIIADKLVGYSLALAIGFALVARERVGRGQEIQVPMFETMVEFNMLEHFWGCAFDPPLSEPGYARMFAEERRPFRTRDGFVCVTATTDAQWIRLFDAVGLPHLSRDSRFSTMRERSFHFREAFSAISEKLIGRTTDEWLVAFDAVDLPNGPVCSLDDLLQSSYLKESQMFHSYDHPTEGRLRTAMPAISFSQTPAGFRRPPPTLGQHTRDVLLEIGCTEAEIIKVMNNDSVSRRSRRI